jgi:hypothetical protein
MRGPFIKVTIILGYYLYLKDKLNCLYARIVPVHSVINGSGGLGLF